MDAKYPRREVLDNPTYVRDDGSKMRPDAVVLDRHGDPLEVREAKDVAVLRPENVLQAFGYDTELRPPRGTTIDIAEDTEVPDRVADLADQLGILLNRLTK